MREFYKKPEFYYFILPFFVVVWILTSAFLTLPTAKSKFKRADEDQSKINGHVTTIITRQPERLKFDELKKGTEKFDYGSVIDGFAKRYGIASSSYSLQAQGKVRRGKQESQGANITISEIDVTNFAMFLTSMQQIWPDLQCDLLSLNKHKNAKDKWKATMKFTYVFKK